MTKHNATGAPRIRVALYCRVSTTEQTAPTLRSAAAELAAVVPAVVHRSDGTRAACGD